MMGAMPLLRTLLAIAALLLLVSLWQAAPTPHRSAARMLSAEMAPATVAVSSPLPGADAAAVQWQPLDPRVLARWPGPFWLRWRFALPPGDDSYVLHLSLRAASQGYWNGAPLRPNGSVGSSAQAELPGYIDTLRALPGPPRAGVNELLILGSSHHLWPSPYSTDAAATLLRTEDVAASTPWRWLIAAVAAGALAAACLYLLLASRDQDSVNGTPVLLSLTGVALLLPAVEAWRPLLGYPYPWHGPRLLLLLGLHAAAAVLLPMYLARRFRVSLSRAQRVGYLAALAAAAVFLPSFDSRGAAVLLMSLLASIAILLRDSGEPDERWPVVALLGTGAALMALLGNAFLDGPYFLLLSVLMGYMLIRHAAQMRALHLRATWLGTERARLSLQLLQRGIHPHWLMNTLTCLQELIEQAPARASQLVGALADQFDQLHDTSQQARIPLKQELALCRNHLDIVSTALDRQVRLDVVGGDCTLELPPGVIHAQLENALTHAGAAACQRQPFRLTVQRTSSGYVLELRSALGTAPRHGKGTGTRFIEASLAAAYADDWRFTQGEIEGTWCSRIEITCAS